MGKCLMALLCLLVLTTGCKDKKSGSIGIKVKSVAMQPSDRYGRGWYDCIAKTTIRSTLKKTVSEFEVTFKEKILMNGNQEIIVTPAPTTKIRKLFSYEDKDVNWIAATYKIGNGSPQALRYGPATAEETRSFITRLCQSLDSDDYFLATASCEMEDMTDEECGAKVQVR